MIIKWDKIQNPGEYVRETLALEADDIPLKIINKGDWFIDEINFNEIKVDQEMLTRHDNNLVHIKRRDAFIISFRKKIEIKPLIVLGKKLLLVDGYARYRAFKKVGIKKVQVLRQKFV